MRTKVFITIDTEFSIGGAFADPVVNSPVGRQVVLCEIGGKSHGLGFLLETFRTYGTRATFFVEALNTNYFGDRPMRELAEQIAGRGHDVQLHLHPCWTYFRDPDWSQKLKLLPPSDYMHSRSVEQLVAWMEEGIETFRRWGLERPCALRTGSMMADLAVYRAMEKVDMHFSSNIAWAIFRPSDPGLEFYSGIHRVGDVVELCVLTYCDVSVPGYRRLRNLTTTGSSWPETRELLLSAQKAGIDSVVLLTHPFEYVKYEQANFEGLTASRINQARLRKLCEFLRNNDDRFETTTFSALGQPGLVRASERNELLHVPLRHALGRMLMNALNDRIRSF